MNKQEFLEVQEQFYDVYCGILFGLQVWQKGEDEATVCRLDPEFDELRTRYPIERAAGRGGAFARALRLCRYLEPRLKHESMYDNHVPCNALALLDYCFERKDVGINCLNKAKILVECCLAVGIPARRVWMYPASPYDTDNHVVTEIYDRKRGGWLALDPTTGAYFIGEEGEDELSLPTVLRRLGAQEGQRGQEGRGVSHLVHNKKRACKASYAPFFASSKSFARKRGANTVLFSCGVV